MSREPWTGASSTAILTIPSRRPTTGLLRATPARPTPTGCSSQQAAADAALGGVRGRWLRQTVRAAAVALLAFGLSRDSGSARFSLTAAGFDRLQGWAEDRLSGAMPAFLKSCARLLSRPDTAAIDPIPKVADYGRGGDWRGAFPGGPAGRPGAGAGGRRVSAEVFRAP